MGKMLAFQLATIPRLPGSSSSVNTSEPIPGPPIHSPSIASIPPPIQEPVEEQYEGEDLYINDEEIFGGAVEMGEVTTEASQVPAEGDVAQIEGVMES